MGLGFRVCLYAVRFSEQPTTNELSLTSYFSPISPPPRLFFRPPTVAPPLFHSGHTGLLHLRQCLTQKHTFSLACFAQTPRQFKNSPFTNYEFTFAFLLFPFLGIFPRLYPTPYKLVVCI